MKVHLGYRIGSEEGGLHYGVIVDVKNDLSSPTATIIPFTSLKPGKDIGKLHRSQVYIGNEIYELLCKKINKEIDETNAMRNRIKDAIKDATTSASAATDSLQNSSVDISDLGAQIKKWNEKLSICEKMHRQIQGMKTGSIALVGQITTVSKIRIYDPIYPSDTLSNIRLSNETMDKLDKKVKELFTNPNLKEKNV